MAVKTSYRVTKGGWALLGVCALLSLGAFNASLNMIYLLSSLLIGMFLIALLLPLWGAGGLDCRRTLPEQPHAGEPFPVDLHARSRRRTAVRFLALRDPLCLGPEGRPRENLVVRLAGGSAASVRSAAGPLARGAHRVAAVTWASGFPFGVAESLARREESEELLVYPVRGELCAEMSLALKSQGTRVGAVSRVGLPSEEFRAVREYKPGDNPRRIHWRATAHHDKLHVREMERERFAPVLVALDSRVPASLGPDERRRAEAALEWAVGFAAEMCRQAQREGSGIAVLAFFPEARLLRVNAQGEIEQAAGAAGPSLPAVPSSPGARWACGPGHVLTALARLTPSTGESASALLDALPAGEAGRVRRIVVVTPTRRTALGVRPLAAELGARLLIASEPEFATVFRPLGAQGEERP
jgi:hypothetical protein